MKKLLIFLLIVIVLFSGWFLIIKTDIFRIKNIKYNKHDKLNEDSLLLYSGINKGDFYFSVDIDKATENIKKHPFVKSVKIIKSFPNDVIFDIEYREHLLTIRYLQVMLSLDENLVVLKSLAEPEDGFIIDGFPFSEYSAGNGIKVDRLYVLQNLVQLIKLFELSDIKPDNIIEYKSNSLVFKIGNIYADFGIGDDYERKFNSFVVIYEDLRESEVSTGTIDVSTRGLPVYRPFGD